MAENTGEAEAVEEKEFIEQVLEDAVAEPEKELKDQVLEAVLEAVQNPGAEHMQVYTGMVLVLAIIGFIVMTACKKEETVKVSLDDIASDKPARKRAGVKKHKDAAEVAKPTATAAKSGSVDWEDCKIDLEGLQQELDTEGPYPKKITGSLEAAAMCKLKRVIGKYAYLSFLQCKEKMMHERIGYLKNKQEKEYQQMIMKAAQKFGKLQFEVTKLAAEFIDLDEANFESSMKEAMQDPAIVKQMKSDDETVRMRCEKARADPLSKEKAKQIVMKKIGMEFETEKKLSGLNLQS